MAWKRLCRCRRTTGDSWLSRKASTSPSSYCVTARKARPTHRYVMMRSKEPNTERAMPLAATMLHTKIQGHVSKGFEVVRDAFLENFSRRNELGAACCVYRHGEKVVDLWGGVRNKVTGEPWDEDTMVIVHSATKGMAAMTLAFAHSRGWLDYEERVCSYWSEFAQRGKETITVRQLLAHQAGLFAFDEPVNRNVVADLDRLALVLARQTPAWPPGTRLAYHPGFLRRRVAASGRPATPQPRAILPGRDRYTPGTGLLHPPARGDSKLQVGHHGKPHRA